MTRRDVLRGVLGLLATALSPLLPLLPEAELMGPPTYGCVYEFECGARVYCRAGETVEMPSRLVGKYIVTILDKANQEAYYRKEDGGLYVEAGRLI